MHAFHADINKRLSIVSAPSSMMGDALRKDSTMYVGAYEFCSNSSDKYFFANGYIDIEQGHVKAYCYYVKDHLGNVRHVDRAGLDNRGNEIVQVSNYYSYGGVHTDVDNGVDVQNHLYNGKELDRMHGLNLYDYSARQYDAAIGQFTSMDPLCEKYYHISPYAYCAGNPVKYVDPDGRAIETAWDVANFVMDAASLCQNAKDGNVGAAIVDGLCLVADGAAVCLPFVPGGAGAAVKAVRGGEKAIKAVDKVSDTAKTIDKASDATRNIGKYSNVAEPKNVAPGKAFTRKQRERLLEENRKRNGGVLTHDLTGEKLNSPKQCKKGQKADMNQAEVDHIIPKSMGGSNSNSNAQIISKRDNLKKGNKLL